MAGIPLDQHTIFIGRKPLGAQSYSLIQAHPFTNDGRLADDDSGPMINEETGANLRARVDIDARHGMGNFRNHARYQGQAQLVKLMRQSMVDDRGNPWITHQHLINTASGRVPLKGRLQITVQQRPNLGQRLHKLPGKLKRLPGDHLQVRVQITALFNREAKLTLNLQPQMAQRFVQRVSDVIIDALIRNIALTQPIRIQNSRQTLNDVLENIPGRELGWMRLALSLLERTHPHRPKFSNNGREVELGLMIGVARHMTPF